LEPLVQAFRIFCTQFRHRRESHFMSRGGQRKPNRNLTLGSLFDRREERVRFLLNSI
jgi:hypothetical protein